VFCDFLDGLEQVDVRGMDRRGLRLEWVAWLGVALAMVLLPAAAAAVQNLATETALSVSTNEIGGHTQATVTVNVVDEYDQPAGGAVSIEDGGRMLDEAALNGSGQATVKIMLTGGAHSLRAVYTGDDLHMGSLSDINQVDAMTGSTPSFDMGLTPVSPSSFPMTLTAGTTGIAQVTVTPVNNAALTSPMFVTLSCSGLPDNSSCTFSPESVEILSTTPASCTAGSSASQCPPVSSMVVQTQSAGTAGQLVPGANPGRQSSPVAWALLLPGMLGLGGLAWGARRRTWLSRLALVALLGMVATMGATGCSPLYRYYQHGPPTNQATPSGTFTVTVTGQSSNGVVGITVPTTFVLTVK
jgi:hypothetical protein